MAVLETQRLLIRPMIESDVEDVYRYSKNLKVGLNAGWKPHESREETRTIMREIFLDRENVWGIILKDSKKLIGSIGLVEDPKRENKRARMLGYALGEEHWGKGLMTEAVRRVIQFGFEEIGLDLISAYCYPTNERSRRVLKKCGFRYEGTLSMAEEIYNGEIRDNECYAQKRQEYGK